MRNTHVNPFMGKVLFLKRIGYALIASSLILLTFLTSVPEMNSPSLALYSYILFAAGFALVLLNKGVEIIQYLRIKKLRAYCLHCGWYGSGKEWSRSECCPECDSEEVTLN